MMVLELGCYTQGKEPRPLGEVERNDKQLRRKEMTIRRTLDINLAKMTRNCIFNIVLREMGSKAETVLIRPILRKWTARMEGNR
jgi:hypothetical protein